MSEQTAPLADALRTLLTEAGPDTFALARVRPAGVPLGWEPASAVGATGAIETPAGLDRVSVQEFCQGWQETLRRWIQLHDGTQDLAIIRAEPGRVRILSGEGR